MHCTHQQAELNLGRAYCQKTLNGLSTMELKYV